MKNLLQKCFLAQFHLLDPDPDPCDIMNTDPDLGGNLNLDPPGSGSKILLESLGKARNVLRKYWVILGTLYTKLKICAHWTRRKAGPNKAGA